MEKIFCARCGQIMEKGMAGGRIRPKCPDCGFVQYSNPVPGAGVLIEMEGGVVLIRRGHEPHQGRWALPAGFIEADESIEEAAIRECKEETGLDVELIEMFHVDSFPNDPTPQSGIIIFYRVRPIGGTLIPGDDAVEAAVFAPENIPHDLAFRTHRAAVKKWAGLHGAEVSFSTPQTSNLAPDVLIRRALPQDEEEVIRLLTLIPANQDLTAAEIHAAHIRFQESTALDVLIAEHNQSVAGFLVLSYFSALTGLRAWIDDVAVSADHRRKGIGQALVEAAIQRASRRGATHLFMDTSRGNPGVREFYRTCGFEDDGVAPLHIR
jgi:8-oxo-dGTP diphosphatase